MMHKNLLPEHFRRDKLFGIWVLLGILIPLSFTLGTSENFDTIKIFFWLIGIASILWLMPKVAGRNNSLLPQAGSPGRKSILWFLSFILAFLFWASLSTIFSQDKINSILGFNYRFTNGLFFFLLWVITIFLAIKTLNRQKILFLLKILVFDALLVSVLGILQSLQIAFYGSFIPEGFARAPSFLGNPNFSGMFLVVLLPFVILFFFQAVSFKHKLYFGLTGFFCVWATVLFSSRGSWLGLLTGFLLALGMSVFYKLQKKYVLVFFLCFLLGAFFWQQMGSITRPNTVALTLNFEESNLNQRLDIWNASIDSMLQKPIFGVGLGNFQIIGESSRNINQAAEDGIFDDPHNLFLLLGASGGFPFLIIFCGILAVAGILAFNRLKAEKDGMALAFLSSIAVFAVRACITPVTVPLFFLLAVLLTGVVVWEREEVGVLDQIPTGRFLAVWAPRLGGLVLFVIACLFFSAELSFVRALELDAQNYPQRAEKYYHLSLSLNPFNQQFHFFAAANAVDLDRPNEQVESLIRKGLSLKSKEANTYVFASNIYFTMFRKHRRPEDFDKAVANMVIALRLDPFFARRYTKLGMYYYSRGRFEPAKEALKTALSLNQKDFTGWVLLAKIYQKQERAEALKFAFERAFRLHPESPQVKFAWQMVKSQPLDRQISLDEIFYE